MIFNMSGGGPSAALNFKVLGGTTEPENPTENTIWVNTDQKITGWAFAADEPSDPVDGMVWFGIGTPSIAEFNALKKNSIQVYPTSGKQYSEGSWKTVDVYVCKSNKWVGTETYLYHNGNENTLLTGGWTNAPSEGAVVTKGATSLTVYHSAAVNSGSGWACTAKPIDLSGYDQIEITIDFYMENHSGDSYFTANAYIAVYDINRSRVSMVKILEHTDGPKDEYSYSNVKGSLDISGLGDGEYYVYVGSYNTDYRIHNYIYVKSIQLK